MASGAKLNNCVMDIFTKMKVLKNDANETKRIRLVSLKIDEDVNVEELFTQEDVDKVEDQDVFKFFEGLLQGKFKTSCRYFLYDCHYDTDEASKKQELVFVLWAPGDAPIKERMQYACSKGCLNKIMDGVKHRLEVNDIADFSRECFLGHLGKGVRALEGHTCGTKSGKGSGHGHDDDGAAGVKG